MNRSEYIILTDGTHVKLNELASYYPFSILRAVPLFIEICAQIGNTNLTELNQNQRYVYINLLALKSSRVKNLTAICLLANNKMIKSVHLKDAYPGYLNLLPSDVAEKSTINDHGSYRSFIDKSYALRLISKYLVNSIYRLFRKRKSKSKIVTRTWIDVTEKIYKSSFLNSFKYLYPFSLNFKRLIAFYSKSFRFYSSSISLMGIPYRFIDLTKVLQKKTDLYFVFFEFNGFFSHAKDFKGFQKVLTTDDFEAGSVILHSKLLEQGIEVTNTAHGIGFYCPKVNYSNFYVINLKQKEYYAKLNPDIQFLYRNDFYNTSAEIEIEEKCVIIIDQGNLIKYGLYYEDKLQKLLYKECENIQARGIYSVFIKIHPNRSSNEIKRLRNEFPKLKVIKNIKKNKKLVFINLYSTAYFDFLELGKIIFIKQALFDPTYYFGDEILTTDIADLENIIIQSFG